MEEDDVAEGQGEVAVGDEDGEGGVDEEGDELAKLQGGEVPETGGVINLEQSSLLGPGKYLHYDCLSVTHKALNKIMLRL